MLLSLFSGSFPLIYRGGRCLIAVLISVQKAAMIQRGCRRNQIRRNLQTAPPPRSSLQIPPNLVTPAAPLDHSGLLNPYQNGYQTSATAIYQREGTGKKRQQHRL